MKNGFTLVELLVVIVLISILGGIGFIALNKFLNIGKKNYYNSLENNILIAGNDYYIDHRYKLPDDDNLSEITLGDLVDSNYIEEIKDSEGNPCNNGKVYAYRENNKYVYEVCLICDNYQSDGKYCKKITVSK